MIREGCDAGGQPGSGYGVALQVAGLVSFTKILAVSLLTFTSTPVRKGPFTLNSNYLL